MDFGHVEPQYLDRIDFTLPPDDPRTWSRLAQAKKNGFRLGIGCPVWSVKEWVGKVYPKGTDPKEFLTHYAQQFTTIELNTTHYRLPDSETVRKWREAAPDGFRFCPKMLQEVSHRLPLSSRSGLAIEFANRMMELGDRLGVSFLQLPPNFSPADLEDLRKFLKLLPREYPIAIEVRHTSFFNEHRLIAPYFDLLAETGSHVVITDVSGRRDVLHTSIPNGKVLIRFIGNNLHPTDHTRLAEWSERLKTWAELGVNDVEFFIHQHEDIHAPDAISFFVDQLNSNNGWTLPRWEPMNQGEQLGFF